MRFAVRIAVAAAVTAGWLVTAPAAFAYLKDLATVLAVSPSTSPSQQSVRAGCPAPKRILGGGGSAASATTLGLASVWPSHVARGFVVTGVEARGTSSGWQVVSQAVCATETTVPPSAGTPATYVNGFEYVAADSPGGSAYIQSARVRCPAGKSVISGGGRLGRSGAAMLGFRLMVLDADRRGFVVSAQELVPTATSWTVKALALCAETSSRALPNQAASITQVQKTSVAGPGRVKTAAVGCPPRMRVIGGGAQVNGPASVVLTESTPQPHLIPGAWSARAENTRLFPILSWQITATAICAASSS